MTFKVKESQIAGYFSRGYAVVEGVVPSSLIGDLRRLEGRYRALLTADATNGRTDQFKLCDGDADLDVQPVRDLSQLPQLHDAVAQLIGCDEFVCFRTDRPSTIFRNELRAHRPCCKSWHRDITPKYVNESLEATAELARDPQMFNSIYCPLYRDSSLWYVPGSSVRDDTEAELAIHYSNQMRYLPEELDAMEAERVEALLVEAARRMPGGRCIEMFPGDLCLFRARGWHFGLYLPYHIRATLGDQVWTPRREQWERDWELRRKKVAKGNRPKFDQHRPLATSGT